MSDGSIIGLADIIVDIHTQSNINIHVQTTKRTNRSFYLKILALCQSIFDFYSVEARVAWYNSK